MILTFEDELLTNTVSMLCPRCFATTPRQISPAVLGFLIFVQCSQNVLLERRRLEFRNLLHLRCWFHRLEELTHLTPAVSASGCRPTRTNMVDHRVLAGSSLVSTFRIASGRCSPASPTRVYERSNPWGPSTFISQLSFARDPTIDTRHSPATSLSTCSTPARISLRARGSPVFCISIVTAISPILYKATTNYFLSKPLKTSQMKPSRVMVGRCCTSSCRKGERGNATSRDKNIFCGTAFARVT
jgi:hypothetical protein